MWRGQIMQRTLYSLFRRHIRPRGSPEDRIMENTKQNTGPNSGQLTRISGNNMGFLVGKDRTPEQIVEFLKEGAVFREFPDVLEKVYPGAYLTE